MSNKFTFTHKEDAERHVENNGGVLHDNTHNNHEWNNNNFTVVVKDEVTEETK